MEKSINQTFLLKGKTESLREKKIRTANSDSNLFSKQKTGLSLSLHFPGKGGFRNLLAGFLIRSEI